MVELRRPRRLFLHLRKDTDVRALLERADKFRAQDEMPRAVEPIGDGVEPNGDIELRIRAAIAAERALGVNAPYVDETQEHLLRAVLVKIGGQMSVDGGQTALHELELRMDVARKFDGVQQAIARGAIEYGIGAVENSSAITFEIDQEMAIRLDAIDIAVKRRKAGVGF